MVALRFDMTKQRLLVSPLHPSPASRHAHGVRWLFKPYADGDDEHQENTGNPG